MKDCYNKQIEDKQCGYKIEILKVTKLSERALPHPVLEYSKNIRGEENKYEKLIKNL